MSRGSVCHDDSAGPVPRGLVFEPVRSATAPAMSALADPPRAMPAVAESFDWEKSVRQFRHGQK